MVQDQLQSQKTPTDAPFGPRPLLHPHTLTQNNAPRHSRESELLGERIKPRDPCQCSTSPVLLSVRLGTWGQFKPGGSFSLDGYQPGMDFASEMKSAKLF